VAVAVLDTSVLIAFRDPADALHARAVAAFRAYGSHHFVLTASVYAEALIGPIRNGASAVSSFEAFIADFAMQIVPVSSEIARAAAKFRAATASLRLPDAFVLATGDVLGAVVVLTGDEAWPKVTARARLI
jgi:predicted nucleic acid-binding protein